MIAFLVKIKDFAFSHKIIAIVILVIILGGGYYSYGWLFNSSGEKTQYVMEKVQKGTLTVSVSGSGQVSALNQIDIKPKASSDVVHVGVRSGQWVGAGAVIAKLDDTDAQKSIRDAQTNLESAKISLAKLKQSSANTVQLHEDAFNTISGAFIDLPDIISGAKTVILGITVSPQGNQSNKGAYIGFFLPQDRDTAASFANLAENDYLGARSHYDDNLVLYGNTNRSADPKVIEELLSDTIETVRLTAQALKSEQNLLRLLVDYSTSHQISLPAIVSTYQSNLNSYTSKNNSHFSGLISVQNSIFNAPLDIASQELSFKQKENALNDAIQSADNYYVRAPFSGIIGQLNINQYSSASAGTAVAVLITDRKLAEISLNEVDVSKIKAGNKVNLTFDAIPDLNIVGEVSEIDSIGAVSQGVVTYNVKISFDTQDSRIKPGMSVSAAIITDVVQDVLYISNSAVKQSDSAYFVDFLENGALRQQMIEVGLSNDTDTEIKSGVKEGDEVVKSVVTSSASASKTTSNSGNTFRIPGMGGMR